MIWIGAFLRDGTGWNRHALGLGAGLRVHERTRVSDWDRRPRRGDWIRRLWPGSVGIGLGAVERLRELPARHRIAFSTHETTRVPGPVRFHLDRADMVWTASEWGARILESNGVPAERLRVVPEGVDADLFSPAPEPRIDNGLFRFLCVGKWEARKGARELAAAFHQEFAPDEPVQLVMHCGAGTGMRLEGGDPRIVASEPVPIERLVALMRNCDAFVLPTRGEAWGLPILEAMACELPCIVTGYGAPAEFATSANSFPVRVRSMSPAADPRYYDPGYDWGEWAEPDWEHLRSQMRYVYEHRAEARTRARQARRDAVERWSWASAARIAIGHIRELRSR